MLAERGREYTDIEKLIAGYFDELEQLQRIKSKPKTEAQEAFETAMYWLPDGLIGYKKMNQMLMKRDESRLAKIFIEAVKAKDAEKISEIAKAVDLLKTNKQPVDRYRSAILTHLLITNGKGGLTVRQLAKSIDWPQRHNEDGLSQLRRLCKELNFPLAPSRQIRGFPRLSES